MQEYLDEIESMMAQVRNDDLGVEDYDFLDRLVHGGSSNNGNNGVANIGAYLAIYEKENGELIVDEELVEELDRRQAQTEQGGGNRISNIVYDATTKKREGKTLLDREVDGHERLSTMLEEFKDKADYEDVSRPDNHSPNKDNDEEVTTDTSRQNQGNQTQNGGDDDMPNADLDHARATVKGAVERNQEITEDVYDAVQTLVGYVNDLEDLKDERDSIEDDYFETLRSFQSYMDQQSEKLDEAEGYVQDVIDALDDIDLHGEPSDVGLQDTLRNPGF